MLFNASVEQVKQYIHSKKILSWLSTIEGAARTGGSVGGRWGLWLIQDCVLRLFRPPLPWVCVFYLHLLLISWALLHLRHWTVFGGHKVLKREEEKRQVPGKAGLSHFFTFPSAFFFLFLDLSLQNTLNPMNFLLKKKCENKKSLVQVFFLLCKLLINYVNVLSSSFRQTTSVFFSLWFI